MRKAVRALALFGAVSVCALAAGQREDAAVFSLAGSAVAPFPARPRVLALPCRPVPPVDARPLALPDPGLKSDPETPPVCVSFFIGPRSGDVFSALHKAYVWKPMSRSLTLGFGLYREIPVVHGVELLPYVGVIRASATLSLAGLNGNRRSLESDLTAFCVGLPLVIRFN
ncbi:MAG TPA: hypothetical protein PLP83_05380 [Candidatus Aminicenantes bacterium]|nr:hypothetical protein [Candidatus Aminicenantes bacterium]